MVHQSGYYPHMQIASHLVVDGSTTTDNNVDIVVVAHGRMNDSGWWDTPPTSSVNTHAMITVKLNGTTLDSMEVLTVPQPFNGGFESTYWRTYLNAEEEGEYEISFDEGQFQVDGTWNGPSNTLTFTKAAPVLPPTITITSTTYGVQNGGSTADESISLEFKVSEESDFDRSKVIVWCHDCWNASEWEAKDAALKNLSLIHI